MTLGGNKNLQDFFEKYDLNDLDLAQKFNTNAAAYYRNRLKKLAEGGDF